MSDVTCPYCGEDQEINHDDGYGYDESELNEQYCTDCNKPFKFQTSISYSYEVFCQDGDHTLFTPLDDKPWFLMCETCEHSERDESLMVDKKT